MRALMLAGLAGVTRAIIGVVQAAQRRYRAFHEELADEHVTLTEERRRRWHRESQR